MAFVCVWVKQGVLHASLMYALRRAYGLPCKMAHFIALMGLFNTVYIKQLNCSTNKMYIFHLKLVYRTTILIFCFPILTLCMYQGQMGQNQVFLTIQALRKTSWRQSATISNPSFNPSWLINSTISSSSHSVSYNYEICQLLEMFLFKMEVIPTFIKKVMTVKSILCKTVLA